MNENNEILNDNPEENIETTEIISEDINAKFQDIENDILGSIENGGEAVAKKKSGNYGKILLYISIVLVTVSVVFLSVYCIVSDISNNNNIGVVQNTRPQFMLNTSGKPGKSEIYADDNGRFTVEGLAEVIKPQIVEIITYEKIDDKEPMGSGSGIIISENGYIVTNTHVLDGMKKIIVNTHDGKSYEAEISGRDAKTDISVIKIEAVGLVPAQFGNSDEVVQGEAVVAIGNPAGLTGSITDGIVSGLNRKIRSDSTGFEMNCIQTDAAISPGNSGGALVNMYGQVIGITSSKYADTTTEGLGFAITINEAKPIIEELITLGYVSGRVRIGITFYSGFEDYIAVLFKEEFDIEIPKELENALWIDEISKDCDIANTELKKNDFILSFDDVPVSNYDELEAFLKRKKGGDVVKARCARISEDGRISYFDIEFKLMADTSGDF